MIRLGSPLGILILGMLAAGGLVATPRTPAHSRTVAFQHEYGVRAPTDTFPHDRHEALACLDCHVTEEGHGNLTFEPPRGCDACHHRDPSISDCAACHAAEDLAAPYPRTFTVTVEDHAPRPRTVAFAHTIHAKKP